MTRVNVDVIAYTDPRFVQLAKLLGFADHDHARSKVEYLWLECTLRGTTELPVWVVETKLGDGGAEALVECELGRYTAGRGDSKTRLVHISGATERCLWLVEKQEQSSKGGKARASTASRAGGKFTSRTPATPGDAPPAQTSPLTLAPALSPAPALALDQTPIVPTGDSAKRARKKRTFTDDQRAIAMRVLGKLGEANGVRYTGSDAHLGLIADRITDGIHELELRAIVAYCASPKPHGLGWEDDERMRAYLTPETLFGPKSHTKYLDPARSRYAKELEQAMRPDAVEVA